MEKITYIEFGGAIRAATERNDHGEAIRLGLLSLKLDEEILNKKLQDLACIRGEYKRMGYLSHDLANERYSIYKFMMDTAKEKMNEKCFAAFYKSF